VPIIYTPIPSIYNSFHRPSVISIVDQLKNELGLDPKTRLNYPDSDNVSIQTGSAIDSSNEPNFGVNEKVSISVDEFTNRQNLAANPHLRPGNRFIMRDEALQVFLRTAYVMKDVVITVRYRAPDRVRARRIRDDLEARMSMIKDVLIHKIQYSYQIPAIFMDRLKSIFELREKQAGYGETFDEWLQNHSLPSLTQLTNTGDKVGYYSFSETSVRIQGSFDYDTVPENPEKEGDMTPHIVEFNYRLTWNAPQGMEIAYPIMIHNQIMPTKFINMDQIKPPEDIHDITGSVTDVSLSYFENTEGSMRLYPPPGIHLPTQDEWRPFSVPVSTLRLVSMLVKLSSDDLRKISRLDQLGSKYYLHDAILEFLIQEAPYLHIPGMSVFNVSIYDDTTPVSFEKFSVNDELEVILNEDADLRRIYRVRLSVYSDFTLIQPTARARLAANPEVLDLVLRAIGWNGFEYQRNNGGVPKSEMDRLAKEQHTVRIGRELRGIQTPKTVMTLMVQARRKEHV